MQYFFSLITDYYKSLDKLSFVLVTLFVAILVFCNYRLGWDSKMHASTGWEKFMRYYVLYIISFAGTYFILHLLNPHLQFPFKLLALILLAPAVFAVKVVFNAHRDLFYNTFSWPHNKYYLILSDYPLRLLIVLAMVWVLWAWVKPNAPFCGLTFRNFELRPYLILLALMVPLIVFASMRPDFLATYPKFKNLAFYTDTSAYPWFHRLLYEISYGIDFVTIEVFFRGFLILAFAHFAGKDAILPMAAFYCIIHFGKPLPECISSYFGGLLLGILVYKTQTIIGGLIVHLGIAWFMEAGGYLGRKFR